ncbi:MAG: hypothetical protein PHS24_03865 [Bacilli bacterium]|nr:hypothetical protein [Bacilli bacterium]
METLVINKTNFNKLKKLQLDNGIYNTECQLFILDNKIVKKLLKIFYINEGVYFSNKLLTINSLIDAKDEINMEELILPEKLVIIGNKVAGFSMPYIDNINLHTILKSKDVPISNKINLLKDIGKIIEKIQYIKPYNQTFHLSDIHEANFIYDFDKKIVCAVDLDSCKIVNNEPSPINFLVTSKNVDNYPFKYPKKENNVFMPNSNTEYFCYMMMILNTISYEQINRLSEIEFYMYLQYLQDLGFSYEFLNPFYNIYTNSNNKFEIESLDELSFNQNVSRAHYKVFKYNYKKYFN